MKRLFLSIIDFYQTYLSFDRGILMVFAPGGACKFNPSCSEFTKQAIKKFGVLEGGLLGLKRIWRCR